MTDPTLSLSSSCPPAEHKEHHYECFKRSNSFELIQAKFRSRPKIFFLVATLLFLVAIIALVVPVSHHEKKKYDSQVKHPSSPNAGKNNMTTTTSDDPNAHPADEDSSSGATTTNNTSNSAPAKEKPPVNQTNTTESSGNESNSTESPVKPSTAPTTTHNNPTESPVTPTYLPGSLTVLENGLLLSQGLSARMIGKYDEPVVYGNNETSDIPFHINPDFGATFVDERPENPGGWIYVSNCEDMDKGQGGVGAFTFDKDGNIIDYRMVLEGTTANCGGGRTPWGSWISCEEYEDGNAWEVDPTGERPAERIAIGMYGGWYESFAYDVRDLNNSHFFMTEDSEVRPLRRFTPTNPNWTDPWSVLKGDGIIDYLVLVPNEESNGGTYYWTEDRYEAKETVHINCPNLEGIDAYENQLMFVSKTFRTMFTLDLDGNTYTNQSTVHGLFDGSPDQMQRIVGASDDLLYFTEEGGSDAGVHARNGRGQFFTILESPGFSDETSGLAFSPNGMHMYVAFQKSGVLFDVYRTDGLPFGGLTLNVKYHRLEDQ